MHTLSTAVRMITRLQCKTHNNRSDCCMMRRGPNTRREWRSGLFVRNIYSWWRWWRWRRWRHWRQLWLVHATEANRWRKKNKKNLKKRLRSKHAGANGRCHLCACVFKLANERKSNGEHVWNSRSTQKVCLRWEPLNIRLFTPFACESASNITVNRSNNNTFKLKTRATRESSEWDPNNKFGQHVVCAHSTQRSTNSDKRQATYFPKFTIDDVDQSWTINGTKTTTTKRIRWKLLFVDFVTAFVVSTQHFQK